MKNLIAFIFITYFAVGQLFANPLSIGDKLPTLGLDLIGKDQPIALESLHGKVILMEFWATWCSPCIGSMKRLKELKKQFGKDLMILAVAVDKPERVERFMENTDFPFLFVKGTEELKALFPFRVIPHTVLIAPDKTVAGITKPEAISEKTITQLLNGEKPRLPLKADRPWDYRTEIFKIDSSKATSFQIQPGRPDAPTFTRLYQEGLFKDRRKSFVNFRIPMLYRSAYNTSVYRMEYPDSEEGESYCVDIITKDARQLDPSLQDSLNAFFGWDVHWEAREQEVWVLSKQEGGLSLAKAKKAMPFEAGGDHFKSEGATTSDFANYLEGYGIFGKAVVDETREEGQIYKFDFSFEPENASSFFKAVEAMGLKVEKEKRTIDILQVFPPKN